VDAPEHGTVTLGRDGAYTYAPANGFSGTDTFSYRARDASLASAPALVSVTVAPGPAAVVVPATVTPVVVSALKALKLGRAGGSASRRRAGGAASLSRRRRGVRRGPRWGAPPAKPAPGARHCTRLKLARTLSATGRAGANTLPITRLKRGRYVVQV